jgi:TonB-dependent Receptor Plug Domain
MSDMPEPPVPPATAVAPELPDNVSGINIQSKQDKQTKGNTNIATVTLKNGAKEIYNLNDPKAKAAFENKYGELPPPPPPPAKPRERRAASSDVKNKDYMVLEVPAKPLYIVDGKEMAASEDLNTISPSDIARVDVLKDKVATEKYGTKGKNGVVKITTKKNIPADASAEIVEVREVPVERVQVTEVPVDAAELREIPVDVAEVRVVPAIRINGKADRVATTESKLPADAIYYIDDVPATKKQVEQLEPSNIQSVDVIKNKETEKNNRTKRIIKITTKKKIAV